MNKGNVFVHEVAVNSTTVPLSIGLSSVVGTNINIITQLNIEADGANTTEVKVGNSSVKSDGPKGTHRGISLDAGKDYTFVNVYHKDLYIVGATVGDIVYITGVI